MTSYIQINAARATPSSPMVFTVADPTLEPAALLLAVAVAVPEPVSAAVPDAPPLLPPVAIAVPVVVGVNPAFSNPAVIVTVNAVKPHASLSGPNVKGMNVVSIRPGPILVSILTHSVSCALDTPQCQLATSVQGVGLLGWIVRVTRYDSRVSVSV